MTQSTYFIDLAVNNRPISEKWIFKTTPFVDVFDYNLVCEDYGFPRFHWGLCAYYAIEDGNINFLYNLLTWGVWIHSSKCYHCSHPDKFYICSEILDYLPAIIDKYEEFISSLGFSFEEIKLLNTVADLLLKFKQTHVVPENE